MSDPSFTDAIVLFGDSITEASNSGSLYQRVAEHYTRKLDVVNRGFAGYNTEWALPVLERLLAKDSPAQKIRLVTVWFGANDSTLETEVQHVPIERYKELLSRFVALLRPTGAKIVFITPPPFVPELWSKGNGREPGNTRRYVDACLAVAEQEKLPCIDIHKSLIETAGGSDAHSLGPYLYDGLHLTPAGYEVAFEMLMKTVDSYYPELAAQALPRPVAAWDTLKRVL